MYLLAICMSSFLFFPPFLLLVTTTGNHIHTQLWCLSCVMQSSFKVPAHVLCGDCIHLAMVCKHFGFSAYWGCTPDCRVETSLVAFAVGVIHFIYNSLIHLAVVLWKSLPRVSGNKATRIVFGISVVPGINSKPHDCKAGTFSHTAINPRHDEVTPRSALGICAIVRI